MQEMKDTTGGLMAKQKYLSGNLSARISLKWNVDALE